MLPNNQYPIQQRETLIRIIRNRCIQRGMSDRDARRRRNHPPNMLIRLIPHLHAKMDYHGSSDDLKSLRNPSCINHAELTMYGWSLSSSLDPNTASIRRIICFR